jgi:effector-binding domain-containing protein
VPEIGPWLGRAYGEITGVLADQGRQSAGPPYARHHVLGNGRFDVEAGFPVSTAIEPAGAVRPGVLPAGPVAVTVHIGPYDAMEPAYARLRRPSLVGERARWSAGRRPLGGLLL